VACVDGMGYHTGVLFRRYCRNCYRNSVVHHSVDIFELRCEQIAGVGGSDPVPGLPIMGEVKRE